MTRLATVALLVFLPALAAGQSRVTPVNGMAVAPPTRFERAPTPTPPTPRPAPPPSAPSEARWRHAAPAAPTDVFLATPFTYAPPDDLLRHADGHHRKNHRPWVWTGDQGYSRLPMVPVWVGRAEPPVQVTSSHGYLRLQVRPATADVFVDGEYAGTAVDFDGTGGQALDARLHRIELRARGFEPEAFDVRVSPDAVVAYHQDLVPETLPSGLPPAVTLAATTPRTHVIYVIPRCYAGTTRPSADRIPVGCDLRDMRIVEN